MGETARSGPIMLTSPGLNPTRGPERRLGDGVPDPLSSGKPLIPGDGQHALHRQQGRAPDLLRHRDLVAVVLEGIDDVCQGDALHIRAHEAGGGGVKKLSRVFGPQGVENAHLRADDEFPGRGLADILEHAAGAADHQSQVQDFGAALGMGDEDRLGMGRLARLDLGGAQAVVNVAAAIPVEDFFGGAPGGVEGQIAVRDHQDPGGCQRIDYLDDIGGGAADVALGLDRGGGIDVGDHRHPGKFGFPGPKLLGGDGGGHVAAHIFPGQEHGLVRAQDGRGFRHEMDPAKHDDLGRGLGRGHGEGQGVAQKIGHILNFSRLVIVGQENPPALFQPAPHLFLLLGKFHGLPLKSRLQAVQAQSIPGRGVLPGARRGLINLAPVLISLTIHQGLEPGVSRTTWTPGGGVKVKKSGAAGTSSFTWVKVKRLSSPRALLKSSFSTR